MRGLLELCVEMDTLARDRYARMAEACSDPDLTDVFDRMSAEEATHIGWWEDLLDAWDEGLIPDIVNDTDSMSQHMSALLADLTDVTESEDFANTSADDLLDIAVRMEFFALDPVFGELMDLMEPGGARDHKESYARHLDRLVRAVEMFYSRSESARFLAHVLRRTWRDNLALAAFASRDSLTGLHNRRGMLAHLRQLLSWANRYGRPLSVILIDVDDFKLVNDAHGHAVGDMALRSVADTLRAAVRHSDVVSRYGGDEFAVIAPETDVAELEQLLDRIVQMIGETVLTDWDGSHIRLTVSVGGATMPGHLSIEPGVDSVLAAADRSLYAAKTAGKNRHGGATVLDQPTVTN